MSSSTVCTFTDPDAYHASIRAQRVDGIITARGAFHAELTRVDFDRLLMQRAYERLPRVLNIRTTPGRIAVFFATGQGLSAPQVSGMALRDGEILVWDSKLPYHHRSAAACQWGAVSLTREDLAAFSAAILGQGWSPPSALRLIRPPAALTARLLNLHEAADHLAKIAPEILANHEVGRAMEQALVEAVVCCLAGADPVGARSVHRDRARVMRRLEQVLEDNPEGPLYMAELCAAVGVSYPTLRACCQEHLGMSPKRYLWLRRMHLARRALRRADPETVTVTEIATNYGFWELGRFSVAYRSLFGESPSTALRRTPDDPKPGEIAGSARQFTKSA